MDTHSDAHVAVALDGTGKHLGALTVLNDQVGYVRLWDWVLGLGVLVATGVEGTGSYGAGLSRFLRARGASVLEVNRTNRQHRRRHGKHDAADAEAAARAVMAGTATGEAKGADGAVESVRALRVARRSAVKARTQVANQLHALLSTAPQRLREDLRGLATGRSEIAMEIGSGSSSRVRGFSWGVLFCAIIRPTLHTSLKVPPKF